MRLLIDSFWRAAFYALHPRVIALSLLPLVIVAVATLGLGKLYWDPVYAWLDAALRQVGVIQVLFHALGALLGPKVNVFVVSITIVTLAIVVIVPITLMLAAVCVSPAAVEMVARRRFPLLERRHGGSWWKGLVWSIACSAAALFVAMMLTPLWLFPPLAMVVTPLIWGWLAAKVMAFDALSEHASIDERRALMSAHRWPLLVAGVVTGFLCGLPSLIWTISMVLFIVWPLVMIAAIWAYTLVFAFAALWFTHYLLAALHGLRAAEAAMKQGANQRAMARAGGADVIDLEPLPPRGDAAAGDARQGGAA